VRHGACALRVTNAERISLKPKKVLTGAVAGSNARAAAGQCLSSQRSSARSKVTAAWGLQFSRRMRPVPDVHSYWRCLTDRVQ
jgi:hypothetical protein